MRKALAERDRRCTWPGCRGEPGHCQGHHETEWVAGGRTDVDQMSLVCTTHHPKLSQGWRLERLPGGGMVAHRPPSQGPEPPPRAAPPGGPRDALAAGHPPRG